MAQLISNPEIKARSYGFNRCYFNVFSKLGTEVGCALNVENPDSLTNIERIQQSIEIEKQKFNDEHYLADLYDSDEVMQSLRAFNPWWLEPTTSSTPIELTDDEKTRLKSLTSLNSSQNIDDNSALNTLCNILFAYAYDLRVSAGEHNCESDWLISNLSSSLSCLVIWEDLKGSLLSAVRRSLCFPLYRNWKLSMRVLKDVGALLKSGKNSLVKCMLDVHKIFADDSECRYVFNDLFITDYCLWLNDLTDDRLGKLYDEIKFLKLHKNDVEFDLEELELASRISLEETKEIDTKLCEKDMGEDGILHYVQQFAEIGQTSKNLKRPVISATDKLFQTVDSLSTDVERMKL